MHVIEQYTVYSWGTLVLYFSFISSYKYFITVPYFFIKLCTSVPGITMMITMLKPVFHIIFPGAHFCISSFIFRELFNISSWGVLGAFWSIFFKGTIQYFDTKYYELTFFFEKEINHELTFMLLFWIKINHVIS